MPNPACSTSFEGRRQPAETTDQTAVTVPAGKKPWLMAQLEAGTDVYFKAFIVKHTNTQLKLNFPGGCGLCSQVHLALKTNTSCTADALHMHGNMLVALPRSWC